MTDIQKKEINDKRVQWLQYINTGLITLIVGFTMMILSTLNTVKITQAEQAKELVRIKTIQDANTESISNLNTRVTNIEIDRIQELKDWIDLNYVRKAQR